MLRSTLLLDAPSAEITSSEVGFDPHLTPLSVLVEREDDDNPIDQLAAHRKRPVLPLLHGVGRCAIEQRIALNDLNSRDNYSGSQLSNRRWFA